MNHDERLARRIKRDFLKCTYIGDISINEEEYAILKQFLLHGYHKILTSASHEIIDPLFAVALVQIGIRHYDGRFWPYVKKELGSERIPQNQQNWIGTSFYKTLLKYKKFHVGENEFMNNILLHCFITKYYADDLFDFLFTYYQLDLLRDLSRNDKKMRNYLMKSMSKGEVTARAYKIKKHTADAVLANPKGCKIRIGRILRFMDNALFYDLYPINSQNRIAQLFCKWAKSSQKFDIEKKRTRGLTHAGEKRFSTPYIHFDTKRECFYLIFPQQYIHLEDNEEIPRIDWKVNIGEDTKELSTSPDSCVTGCKTEKIETFILPPKSLLNEVNIELWKNGSERIRRFKIRSDSVRFFDSDWDMIDSETYAKYLPVGNAFAFCSPGKALLSDSDSVVASEKKLGYDLYTLKLEKGDILRLPDGKAKSVGKPLEEGILSQNLVFDACAIDSNTEYPIYRSVPSVYFRMTPAQENGTLIIINGTKHRFDTEKCIRFDADEETAEKGYLIKLRDLISVDGIYDMLIDVPNSRKERRFSFAFLSGFSYRFENAPYIFQEKGTIVFSENSRIRNAEALMSSYISRFDFDFLPNQDYLLFLCDTDNKPIRIRISIPVLKWKFDNEEWKICHPEEIWHKEFPKMIYIKYPGEEITFSMSPTMSETLAEDDENNSFSATFNKNKENQMFECDTRKMISWFGSEDIKRTLHLIINDVQIPFANILIKSYIESCNIVRDSYDRVDRVTITVYSKETSYVDIYRDEKLVLEKSLINRTKEYTIPSFTENRKYVVCLYTKEYDDFGSGDDLFDLCDKKEYIYNDLGNITNQTIRIFSAHLPEMKEKPISFSGEYCIKKLTQKSVNEYEGILFSRKVDYRLSEMGKVGVCFLEKNCVKLSATDIQFSFYYGYMTESLYLMNAPMLIRSANPREYMSLNEFFYKVEIGDENKNPAPPKQTGITKKYNYPLEKTPMKASIRRKLENSRLFSTDQIVDYGVDRLCTIPKIRQVDALDILDVLEKVGYRFSAIEQIRNHYSEKLEEQ